MGGVISFFIFFLLGILDTVFAVKLNLSPWKFLLAGNPRLYDMECFQRAAGMLCAIYAGVFYMTALFVLLTQILCVMPNALMAGMLYIHGAVLTMTAFGLLAYLDSSCQVQPRRKNCQSKITSKNKKRYGTQSTIAFLF